MSVAIDALYIYDDHNNSILSHTYANRPPTPSALIASVASHPRPRPAVLRLHDLSPPTTAYTLTSSSLFLCALCHRETPSLAVLDFLSRLIDIFEDFLGAPLLPSKIEENYEIVAQLLGEVCDGGIVANTEGNSLRESVEVGSVLGKLFTQVGLPGPGAGIGASSSFSGGLGLRQTPPLTQGPAIPWRRSNVRHTSNELYVDIIESLAVIYAPSGRPVSARANGSILFTAKISGVPDLLLTLSAPGGTSVNKGSGLTRAMDIPVFHPCVRLNRWRDAAELSFVPPDGKFVLAGYETDLLPSPLNAKEPPTGSEKIWLPATVDLVPGKVTDFEARLTLSNAFPGVSVGPKAPGRAASSTGPFSFGSGGGNSSAPSLDAVTVHIPFPSDVRNVTDLKASRGEASFNAYEKRVEWRVPTKDGATINGVATLAGNVVGDNANIVEDEVELGREKSIAGYYEDDVVAGPNSTGVNGGSTKKSTKALLPRSISVSFSVKGWLPSGIKVESLMVDVKKSKGLGDGVRPYKGVKYLTVSREGVERRIS